MKKYAFLLMISGKHIFLGGKMNKKSIVLLLACFAVFSCMAQIKVKDKESIAFAGDKTAVAGKGSRVYKGYMNLVADALKSSAIKVKTFSCGVSNDTAASFCKRMPEAVLAGKPQWMVLSLGINDAFSKKTTPEEFKKNIVSILDLAGKSGLKVIVLTTIPYGEVLTDSNNKKLVPYNDFLREEAKKRSLPLADVNKAFADELVKTELADIQNGKLLLHKTSINGRGHFVIASVILEAMGFSKEKVASLRMQWEEKYPAASIYLNINFSEFVTAGKEGAKKNMGVKEYIADTVKNVK